MDLSSAALRCLREDDVETKLRLTREVGEDFLRGRYGTGQSDRAGSEADARASARARGGAEFEGGVEFESELAAVVKPGRPVRPRLVAPRLLPQRGLGSPEGRAAFLHAIAHIEFNAINLAWDAVCRFRDMPWEFHADWVAVAVDEARHFTWLQTRMAELGAVYGDFDGHDGLWQMAVRTRDCCRARMALVPRVLEARGLDVTPTMIARLQAVGDHASAEILERILREEIPHVAAGSRWFVWCCRRDGLDPLTEFRRLLAEHGQGVVRGPFNLSARRAAGFSDAELLALAALTDG